MIATTTLATERRFGAMGTTVHLIGIGGAAAGALDRAEARVHQLEARWSRFQPRSELSRLNDRAGTPTRLSSETFALVTAAVDGWARTKGRFDPTVLGALEAAGYDRSFEQLPADRPSHAWDRPAAARGARVGCGEFVLDADTRTLWVPAGIRVDFGGIAKGYAADLVVAELAGAGLEGACANLGGDVRVWGAGPDPAASGWIVDVEDPTSAAAPLARLELDDGALVTSTRLRRRWLIDGVEQHHLIDPRTGHPAHSGWAQMSVVAGTATAAEVLVKAAFVAGPEAVAVLEANDARAVLVADDGRVETVGFA